MNLRAISYVDLLPLFPKPAPKSTIIDLIPKPKGKSINDLLVIAQRLNDIHLQFRFGKIALLQNDSVLSSDIDYGRYLQFPNRRIESLAMSVVNRTDSDDVKAWKLLRWVEDNILYTPDIKNYGQDEFWALPTMTLAKKKGDCEDGAFLLGSLMLNAKVNPNRIRVYGGFVSAGTNASTGGHAWVAYKRETDNQWVALDWCYFPTDKPVNKRVTLEEDSKYIDDYFFVTSSKTEDTTYKNTIRDIFRKTVIAAYTTNTTKPQQEWTVDIRV